MITTTQVLNVVGQGKQVKASQATDISLYHVVSSGQPIASLRAMQRLMGFTHKEISEMMGISESTLLRRYKASKQTLTREETDRLIGIAEVIAHGMDVYESVDLFKQWLHTALPPLGNQKPIELLWSSIGRAKIKDILTRIEYGHYS